MSKSVNTAIPLNNTHYQSTGGGVVPSRALWCVFDSVYLWSDFVGRGRDFLPPFGPPLIRWVHVWEFNPCWKEHQVACGMHLHTHTPHARMHTHIYTPSLTVWDPDVSSFKWSCICREASGPHGTGPSCLLMGRFSISLRHSFVRPLTLAFSFSHNTHTHTLTPCVDDASRDEIFCRPLRKDHVD